MMRWFCIFLMILVAGCSAGTAEIQQAETSIDWDRSLNRLSYAAGYKLGDMFQNQKLTLVSDAVLKGINDARKNVRPLMSKGVMRVMLRDPKKYLIEDSVAQNLQIRKESETFLLRNGQRGEVVVRDSGLQYLILREGKGRKPAMKDRVKLNYQGKTLKGEIFSKSSTAGKPLELNVQNLVAGMAEGLQLMQEGAKWELYIPSKLAYADRGPLAGQTLIFEVELLEVLSASQ